MKSLNLAPFAAGRDTLRFDLQNTRADLRAAQMELQPWKDRAKKEFPFDDVTSALAKLDAKTETVLAMFRSSIVNPLNEPITAATCTVALETGDGNPGEGKTNIGTGGYAAFGLDGAPILIAKTINHIAHPNGRYEFTGAAGVFDTLMNKPVNSITRAQFIQIGTGFLKDGTQILGGTVVWVINNRISLRYKIPVQKVQQEGKTHRISVPDLRAGIAQLDELAKLEPTSPSDNSNPSSRKSPQSTTRDPSAPLPSRE